MTRRLVFGAIVCIVFLASVLTSWTWPIAVVTIVSGVIWLASRNNAWATRLNRGLGFFMRTGRRMLVTTLGLALVSLVILKNTNFGPPLVPYAVESSHSENYQDLEQIRVKLDRLYHGLPAQAPAIANPKPGREEVQSIRDKWRVRFFATFLLFTLFVGYLPAAMAASVRRAWHETERRHWERTGEVHRGAFKELLGRLIRAPRTTPAPVTTTATPAPVAAETAAQAARAIFRGGQWWWPFLLSIAADFFLIHREEAHGRI